MPRALDPRVDLSVLASGDTERAHHEEVGDALHGPHSAALRAAQLPLVARLSKLGSARALAQAETLIGWMEDQPRYRALCENDQRVAGRRLIKKSIRFPRPPRARLLHARLGLLGADFPIETREAWEDLADALARLREGAPPKPRHVDVQNFFAEMEDAGWLREQELRPPIGAGPGILFVGHNSAIVASFTTRVMIDPWLRPWHDGDPDRYRPLCIEQWGHLDAMVITHGHGDHFHLGTLLRIPRDTLILVPRVAQSTLLATSLAQTLSAIGFSRVVEWQPGERRQVGDLTLEALPFFGEQPTASALIDETIRNVGCTCIVRTPDFSAAFLADTGADARGSMREAAHHVDQVDVVFSGARGFSLAPLFFPTTTLDVFLANVPIDELTKTQALMHDAETALDCAEAFRAKLLVPYADGGAPWYWREGMGPSYAGYPSYPGWRTAPSMSEELAQSDPFPERVVECARVRQSAVRVECLRPNDSLRMEHGRTSRAWRIERPKNNGWIYDR